MSRAISTGLNFDQKINCLLSPYLDGHRDAFFHPRRNKCTIINFELGRIRKGLWECRRFPKRKNYKGVSGRQAVIASSPIAAARRFYKCFCTKEFS